MTGRTLCWAALAAVAIGTTGCHLFDGPTGRSAVGRSLTPNSADYRDPTSEEGDPWSVAGREGRGDRPRERDPDRWWRNWVMSPKARAIESNMGVD